MRLGVKARFTDAESMARLGTDLIEVFVGERDLSQYEKEMVKTFCGISAKLKIEYVIHNQEYFTDDKNYHLVDLASQDENLRKQAIKIVKKTLGFAEKIYASYVIIHPGGISPEVEDKQKLLNTLEKSLVEIGDKRLILENMPWFYIMRNGEIWRSNICVEPEDFFNFSDLVGGVTFDICHAYLSTKEGGNHHIHNMKQNLKDMIRHVHIADAKPPHNEGIQIGEGNIDFTMLADFKVGVVPEIIGGHENDGEGFKIAIARLSNYQ
ncbi:MAG: sugar phosphate isomerase/epimerase [Thermoplasmata archaeon]|nr:MAG: sugar phosphate isomerase/epimerase [Thermoplasmata archaeon]